MLILASQSPRRRDLLEREGVDFRVVTRETEEVNEANLPPEDICARNAAAKALAVAAEHPQDTVVGADTLVFLRGKPLGKPADEEDAFRMLSELQGKTHCVCTAVAVVLPGGERRDFTEKSYVTFRRMTPEAIRHYLSEVYVLDKAGAYAMQEKSELIVEKVEGDVDNVIGLPVTRLLTVLGIQRSSNQVLPDEGLPDEGLPDEGLPDEGLPDWHLSDWRLSDWHLPD